MKTLLTTALWLLLPAIATSQDCMKNIFISDYGSDNVLVYDGCDGSFKRLLDTAARINGPQALRLGPDDLLYVVSEENHRILRYNPDTFAFVDAFIVDDASTPSSETGGLLRPTGIDFSDGRVLVSSYEQNLVYAYDAADGRYIQTLTSAGLGGNIDGFDAGLRVDDNDRILVPGYDSNSIGVASASSGSFISAITSTTDATLFQPRVIELDLENRRFWVSSFGNASLFEYNLDSLQLNRKMPFAPFQVTGVHQRNNGNLLVLSQRGTLYEIDVDSGENLGELISRDGSIQAGVFVLEVDRTEVITTAARNDQYWVVGTASIEDRSLVIDQAVFTGGTVFGENFDADSVTRGSWGSMRIDFTDCSTAILSYESSGGDSAGFGVSTNYPLQRLASNYSEQQCLDLGFDQLTDPSFMNGSWFGGIERSGEGLLIDVFNQDLAFVAWFTYGKPDASAE